MKTYTDRPTTQLSISYNFKRPYNAAHSAGIRDKMCERWVVFENWTKERGRFKRFY